MPFLHERKSFILRSRQIENTAKRNGLRHTIFNTIGDQYIGEWKDDKKSGKGKIITRAGELYEGDLEGNRRHGFGVLARKLPNRDVFELIYRGDWKNGKMSGTGLRIFPDGGFYVGGWKNGKREGHGRHWYSDGAFYDGQYKNDMRHGLGILIKADGNGYEGAFKSDKKRGKGMYFHLDRGQLQEGVWNDDCCVFSTFRDIGYRQCAANPAPYPIPSHLYARTEVRFWNVIVGVRGIGIVEGYKEKPKRGQTAVRPSYKFTKVEYRIM
ncbi:MORN repeat-containing protein 3-like isoform X2 [Cylas formicarius]|nr:MORN repeat-containing protein 3-like isoform X2 [Cylas formicarius]